MSSKHGQGNNRKCLPCSQKEGIDIIVSGKSVNWHLEKKHKGLRISDVEFEIIGKMNHAKDVGATIPHDQHANFSQSTRSKSIQKNIQNGISQTKDQVEADHSTSNTAEPILNKFENLLGKLDDISQPSSSNNSTTKLLIDELKEYVKQQQSTSGQSHEQCNKLIEELKSDKSKLEKKVEDRDQQLAEARTELKQ